MIWFLIPFFIGLAVLVVIVVGERVAGPIASAARDIEPTPDEADDSDRLSNPARRPRGLTLAQVQERVRLADQAGAHRSVVDEEPDELDGDPAEIGTEEEPQKAPAVADAPFVIQGEPTEEPLIYAGIKPVSGAESGWMRVGWGNTSALPVITDEPLEVQQARYDAAQVLAAAR